MFTVQKSEIAGALNLIKEVIERRNTIPILANVRIVPDGDALAATGTDLDREMTVRFAPDTVEAFAGFTVPAQTLADIVGKLPDGQIRFEPTDRDIVVRAGRSRFTLPVLPVADFPDLSTGDLPARFELDAEALADALAGVRFAISTEETRYYLNGIYLHPDASGRLVLVATDGHRLAKRVLPVEDLPEFAGIILPRGTIGTLAKQLAKHDHVTIELSDQKIRLTAGNAVLVSKLIDGTFPDYARVIPAGGADPILFSKPALAAAIARVTTISTERGRAVRFAFGDGLTRLSARNPDAGNAEDEVTHEGRADCETGFNGKYVEDALGSIDGDNVEMLITDPGAPAILRKSGQTDDLVVLMPMRA